MIPFPLETDRVLVRPFIDGDDVAMRAVYGDPEVMRHVAHGTPASHAQIAEMLEDYRRHQHEHGYGFWAVLDRQSHTVIGDVGFEARDEGAEFGYTLARAWWGRGLATETGSACVNTILTVFELPWLSAVVDPANPASARVLDKLGFVFTGEREAYGRTHHEYLLTARP